MSRALHPDNALRTFQRVVHYRRAAWRGDVVAKPNARDFHATRLRYALRHIDLVEVVDSEGADVEPGLYFCDSIGFKKIY